MQKHALEKKLKILNLNFSKYFDNYQHKEWPPQNGKTT